MRLVERHIIKKSDNRYLELSKICHLSKNLYNSGLYAVRQYFFETEKYLNYKKVNKKFVETKQIDYYNLPAKVSQQTLKIVEQNFKSFFGLLKAKKEGKLDEDVKVCIPHYLEKEGKFITTFTNQAISTVYLKKRIIKLSGVKAEFKTFVDNIQQVRLVPKFNCIVLEVIYIKIDEQLRDNNLRYCSIDLGLNNLATVASNVIKPFIINGKPLKSINQFYNKEKSKLQSFLQDNETKYVSNRIERLSLKRGNKISDYLHKASRYIINHLVSNEINTLVIGYNQEWKQEINIGKKNNQSFVNIPFLKFVKQIEYKAKLKGIKVIRTEESYTSKCSFLDNESVEKYDNYLGKRIKRGLFKTSKGKLINADLNGALNILKKEVGEFQYPIEACSTPLKIYNFI